MKYYFMAASEVELKRWVAKLGTMISSRTDKTLLAKPDGQKDFDYIEIVSV
jgi:hypothetical protein